MAPLISRNVLRAVISGLLFSAFSCVLLRAQTIAVQGTAIDVDLHGNVYVLDAEGNTLSEFDRSGGLLRVVGGPGWQDAQFDRPAGLWARNGIDVFVADYGNHRIERFDRALSFVSSFSTHDSGNPDERFGYPSDVALSREGGLFISDTENSRIVKVDQTNTVERTFGDFGAGKGRLTMPRMVGLGPKDEVYVLDGSALRFLMPSVISSGTWCRVCSTNRWRSTRTTASLLSWIQNRSSSSTRRVARGACSRCGRFFRNPSPCVQSRWGSARSTCLCRMASSACRIPG